MFEVGERRGSRNRRVRNVVRRSGIVVLERDIIKWERECRRWRGEL